MIDRIILAPYFFALKFRHFLYDHGIFKSRRADVPTICIGNITVGGTGKTPHTEMVIRMLREMETPERSGRDLNIAVLSRGYKRKSRGFQQVMSGTDADFYGDEPLQIKNKFPDITVAVDAKRYEGCDFLCHPEKLQTSKKAKKCLHKELTAPDIIILDDAFQHRALKPSLNILLIDYNRPIDRDLLIPMGRLRDLTERKKAADVIIVSKCPAYISVAERENWIRRLGISHFDPLTLQGTNKSGLRQTILFTTIESEKPEAVYPEGDNHYIYSKRAIAVSGIANDKAFLRRVKGSFKLMDRFSYGDHHKFTASDIAALQKAAEAHPTAIVVTTEKDSQRLAGLKNVPEILRRRTFHIPIISTFLSEEEAEVFRRLLADQLAH